MEDFLLAREVREKLEGVRQSLIHQPSQITLETTGSTLESVAAGLSALHQALESGQPLLFETRAEMEQIFALSSRVNALYRQAAGFYGGLAAEAVANGAWDQAAYSPNGEWSEVQTSATRVLVEG